MEKTKIIVIKESELSALSKTKGADTVYSQGSGDGAGFSGERYSPDMLKMTGR